MAKRRSEKVAPARPENTGAGIPLWERGWFPAAVFLALSLAYFHEFAFSDKVIFGYDAGLDYHKGEGMGVWEKVQTLAQPMWKLDVGGFPESEEIRPQYFPLYFIYFFTSFHRYLGWRYILTMFLAGLGTYLFLRQLRIGRWAALWAGVAYMSAPTLMAFTYAGQYAKMGVIALFPWMWFFLERGLEQRRLIHFAGLGVAIAASIYSPHPQMLYYALCGTGLYFLFRLYGYYQTEKDGRRALGRTGYFVFSVALGLALGAEGVFPLYLYTGTESKRARGGGGGERSAAEQLAYAQSWSLHPEEVGALIVPEFGGFSVPKEGQDYYWGRNPRKDNSEYFGILAVLLALLVVPEARQRLLVLFLASLFALVLAYALGGHTPVHWLAFHLLPGVKVMRTVGMAAFVFAFPACVLAGLGLERVLKAEKEEGELLRRRLLMVGGTLTGIALLVALAPGRATEIWNSIAYSDLAPYKRQILDSGRDWLARGGLCVALVAGLGTGLLYLRLAQKLGAIPLIAGLGLLTLFDTWRIDRVFLRYEDPDQYLDMRQENPRAVQFLKSNGELFRIFPLPTYRILEQPGFHLEGVPMVAGFNNLTIGRYDRMLREIEPVVQLFSAKYLEGRPIYYADENGQRAEYSDEMLLEAIEPLLNLLNGKYLVVPRVLKLEPPTERFPLVFEAENFRLYENPRALPWFYLAPSYRVVGDEEQAIELLRDGQIDPRRTVLLEKEPPAFAGLPGRPESDRIERLEYDPPGGYIRLRTRSDGPRLLVVSENYHSNWRVVVNGQDQELYRANYVWKAVFVPPGEHVVEFIYFSRTLAASRVATFLGLAVVLGIAVREYWQRTRGAKGDAVAEAGAG